MNDKINLCEILKDCPKGTILYSPLAGEVEFYDIEGNGNLPIRVMLKGDLNATFWFTKDGRYYDYPDGECTLFPSKEQRDWSKFTAPWCKKDKFDPKTLKPFDRVLVRDYSTEKWTTGHFSYIEYDLTDSDLRSCDGKFKFLVYISGWSNYWYVLPYNEDTKHLVGTTNEAPEYYRYWED